MSKDLPLRQAAPFRLASVRCHARPVSEPGLGEPVPSSNIVSIGIRRLDGHNNNTCHDDSSDADELCEDEEVIQSSAGLGADGIGHVHNDQDQDGKQLMLNRVGLVSYTGRREYALDEDYAQNGQRRRHDGDDPRPGRQETKDIAEYVLEVWLNTTYARHLEFAQIDSK
jgi:hypothetical protein